MMTRVLIIAGFAMLCAFVLPDLASRYVAHPPAASAALPQPVAARHGLPPASGAREVVLPAGPGGHFQTVLDINGRNVSGMIDTGATVVAINDTTARQIGLSPASLDYSRAVSTANGEVKAAAVSLRRIRIGGIAVEDVEALVLPDAALSDTLIGMSFLNRLSSYSVENGALRLRR